MTFENALGTGGLLTSAVGTIYNIFSNEKWSNKNYNMQKDILNYQKYLNNNQQQMQVADAQKAGINPLAMNGGSVSAGSYSNVQPAQADASGLTSMAETLIGAKTQKEIAKGQEETQKEVAKINAQSAQLQTQMKIDADKAESEAQRKWQGKENEAQRSMEKLIKAADRESNELIAKNNLNQKEAEAVRTLNLEISKFNAQLQESFASAEQQSDRDYESLKMQAWNVYKEWKYGLKILGHGDMFTSITDNLTEKLGNFGNAMANLFREEKKNANSTLSYSDFSTWFNKNYTKHKPSKTDDIKASNEKWEWK